jgi:hypothetical protein
VANHSLRLLLNMMGLDGWVFGASWLLSYLAIYGSIAFLMSLFLHSSFMWHVDFSMLFVFIAVYCTSQVFFIPLTHH